MSGSNYCFLTCILVSQEASNVVWYSYFFKHFPQFVVIYTVKWFHVVNEVEVTFDVAVYFLEFPCFFYDPIDVGNLICGSSTFSKSSLYSWRFLGYCNCFPAKFSYSLISSKWNWPHIYFNDFTTLLGNLNHSVFILFKSVLEFILICLSNLTDVYISIFILVVGSVISLFCNYVIWISFYKFLPRLFS